MGECNHCWHDTGNMLTSNPPQYQLICCHCGETENLRSLPPFERDNGEHGEFAKGLPLKERLMTTKVDDPILPTQRLKGLQDELNQINKVQPTIEQIGQELNAWLQERNVSLQIVAVGKRTGQPCPIDDFLPPSHDATVTLVKVQK